MNKFKKLLIGGIAATLVLGGTATAFADATNGSFETGVNPGSFATLSAVDNSSINNWTVETGSVDYIGTYWQPGEGERSIDLNGTTAGSISQTLTTVPGHLYKVSFELAGNPDGAPTVKTLDVTVDDDEVEEAVSLVTSTFPFSFDTTGKTKEAMGWVTKTFNFTADDASTVLAFVSTTEGAFGPAIDYVRVEDITPVTPSVTPAPTGPEIPAQCDQNLTYNVINGTNASEIINGTNGNDLIFARGGSDKVDGRNGHDCIVGGEGSDSLRGGNGNDVILGQAGSDDLRGDNGADTILGGAGSDSLRGDNGNDTLNGQADSDVAKGGSGTDTCTAEAEQQCEL